MSGFLPENPGVIKMDMIAKIRRQRFVENENADTPSSEKRLPEYGMQLHGEYTMQGHFFLLKRLLGKVEKW